MKCLYIGRGVVEGIKCGGEMYSGQNIQLLIECFGKDNVDVIQAIPYNNTSKRIKDKILYLYLLFRFNYLMGINKDVISKIIEAISKKKYDIVFVDGSPIGCAVEKIKSVNSDVKIFVFFHNIEVDLIKKIGGLRSRVLKGAIEYNELIAAKYADRVLVLNERDMILFKKYYANSEKISCLPMGLKDRLQISYKKKEGVDGDKLTMLFVGANYKPNVEGVDWFVNEVMPNVNATLYIVGKQMEVFKYKWQNENVKVIGSVDDIDSYYISVDLVIEPIFSGGGMKTKTAEALMFGKRILGTKEAFEGYDIDGVNSCVVCNEKKDYIKQIKRFENKRIKYFSDSRELYRRKYSFDNLVSRLKKIVEDTVGYYAYK